MYTNAHLCRSQAHMPMRADYALSLGGQSTCHACFRPPGGSPQSWRGTLQRWGVAVRTPATCPARSDLKSHPSIFQVALLHRSILEPTAPLKPEHRPLSSKSRVALCWVGPALCSRPWGCAMLHPEPASFHGRSALGRRRSWSWGSLSANSQAQPSLFPRAFQCRSCRYTELHGHAEP